MHPSWDHEEPDEALARAAGLLRAARRLAVLTGAGVSAESGLATFRGGNGLWEGHRIEEVATPFGFQRDPVLVWKFYNARRAALHVARPNPGHAALVALEDHFGPERFALITQNVDGLHRAAGTRRVLELHGNLLRVRCTECGRIEDRGTEPLPELPRCDDCQGLLRPDVVWFHEPLPEEIWQQAEQAARASDCLLVVGTSAVVYPAASLIDQGHDREANVIEVNLEVSRPPGPHFVALCGPSGRLLPELVARLGLPVREQTPQKER